MPNMSLIRNICNFVLRVSLIDVQNQYERVKIWQCSMFSDPAVALLYRTGCVPQLIGLLWVWSEPFAILSWVWVWSTSETGMRGVKIWHHLMFSDPAVALSYQSGSIPRLICLIWIWSETFAIFSWVWVWSTSETGMRGVKILHRSMFSEFEFDWHPKPVWEESKYDIVRCSHIQLWLCHIKQVVSIGRYA